MSTSQDELIRNTNRQRLLIKVMETDVQLIKVALPNCQVTVAIIANEATFTPSRKVAAAGDFRSCGTSGPLIATKKKAGRNIPIVAKTAPGMPDKI